ncbi:MAG: hypothetical protein EA373_04535 [Oceanospirillales bacterium]|nr:MAG: hypothetical protein EA373_04535 [Oceanospirillales bacterium]
MQLVLDLNREGFDLLGVDRKALMVLIDKARQEGTGPLFNRLDGLQELYNHMNRFAAHNDLNEIDTTPVFSLPSDLAFPPPTKHLDAFPVVKFSATDPCADVGNKDGLPWDYREVSITNDLALGENVIPALVIPNLHQVSGPGYNSAVSIAFEGMRLVYGPMSDDQSRGFEAAWTPLFDYPTQEIIDYLNQLNPLISQFLSSRESYIRTLNDLQLILMDAAMAIEADDRFAWEAAMAQATLNASALNALESSMFSLAGRIEALGNPPDPNFAKCEANRRYRKFFEVISPEGSWAGYQDNIFLSDGKYNLVQGGTNPETYGLVYNPIFTYIFKVNVNKSERYFSIRVCFDCNLGSTGARGNVVSGDYRDRYIRENISGSTTYSGLWIDGPRQGEVSTHLQKFEGSNFPEFTQVSSEQINRWISIDRSQPPLLRGKERFFRKMLDEQSLAPHFFATAREWTQQNRWNNFNFYEDSMMVPDDLLVAFNNDMMSGVHLEIATPTFDTSPEAESKPSDLAQAIIDEQEETIRRDAIDFHTEMIGIIKHNLDREMADRNEARRAMVNAKTQAEVEEHARRIKEYDLRIINLESNMQAEQDLINTHKTGELVRTRTAFDEYARHLFIESIRENAARMDATRRIAERIDRQIELLPWEIREATRARVYGQLDAETVASGNIEKARRVVNAINEQIQGYAQYDHALAKEAEVDAQQHEFYAQMTILATGAVFTGLGSSALVNTYGAQTATAIYGTKTLGAVYGGTTGFIAGGPADGVKQSVSNWSPVGSTVVQFIDGFNKAGLQPNVSMSDQIWEGVKQAGTGYLTGKAFELGTRVVTQGSLVFFGKESRLFKPIISPPSQRSSLMLDGMRTQQAKLNAQDEIATFRSLESELNILKINPTSNASKIAQLENQLNKLAAGLNMSYHAKWHLKYKADPLTRMRFSRRLENQYTQMTPGMIKRLEQQGYNMEGIEFKQFRNSSSAGSSSMDLDLGPVYSSTGVEPGIRLGPHKLVVKKNGSVVTLAQFNEDAQLVMNAEWKELTGMSASLSDMNLTTSAHRESFSTPLLLDHNIDFSTFTSEEVASVGKVLKVKMDGIDKNKMLTHTTKMQAKSREAAKEIKNMLGRKFESDLANTSAGSPERSLVEADIKYWEDMLQRLQRIGSDESNPAELMRLNMEIRHETGGRDANGVIADLISKFN